MHCSVVGIDPAFSNVGFALGNIDIESNSVTMTDVTLIRTKSDKTWEGRKSADDLRRAQEIHDQLHAIINQTGAEYAFIEIPQGTQSARAAWSLGIVLGLIASINIPIIQVSARDVKIRVTGNPKATKREMIDWAMKRHPDVGWAVRKSKGELVSNDGMNEHMADACAVIECGLNSDEWLKFREKFL